MASYFEDVVKNTMASNAHKVHQHVFSHSVLDVMIHLVPLQYSSLFIPCCDMLMVTDFVIDVVC